VLNVLIQTQIMVSSFVWLSSHKENYVVRGTWRVFWRVPYWRQSLANIFPLRFAQ